MISRSTGQLAPAQNFFRSLPLSTECQLVARRWVCGHLLWVTGMRLPSGDYLIVVAPGAFEQIRQSISDTIPKMADQGMFSRQLLDQMQQYIDEYRRQPPRSSQPVSSGSTR